MDETLESALGPLESGPLDRGPLDRGPLDRGPLESGPLDRGPLDRGPLDRGPLDRGPLESGPRSLTLATQKEQPQTRTKEALYNQIETEQLKALYNFDRKMTNKELIKWDKASLSSLKLTGKYYLKLTKHNKNLEWCDIEYRLDFINKNYPSTSEKLKKLENDILSYKISVNMANHLFKGYSLDSSFFISEGEKTLGEWGKTLDIDFIHLLSCVLKMKLSNYKRIKDV